MASINLNHASFLLLLALAAASSHVANASDPDILSDFVLPSNATAVYGSFFTYTSMRSLFTSGPLPTAFTVTKATVSEFPALDGQSVSMAVLMFPPDSVNPPHTHPRSAELLFLIDGTLEVGFVDGANELYSQVLQQGDMFVFPKGLVHYQYNVGKDVAVAISAFGSANAGTVSVPKTVFGTGIDDGVLARAFKTDVATVQKIKSGLSA